MTEYSTVLLYDNVVAGNGSPASAYRVLDPVLCTGLTKANGTLVIDLRADEPSYLGTTSYIELTSSGGSDTNEWNVIAPYASITSAWQTFEIPLSSAGTSGGELNVAAINFIRWVQSASSGTIHIYWRRAYIRYSRTVASIAPYCAIDGYLLSGSIYSQGVSPSGGELNVEEISYPGRDYADIRLKGRNAKKYKLSARSADRNVIENFLRIVNNASYRARFYPFDAERFGLIASTYAALKSTQPWGAGYNFYEAEAEITCREPFLLGPDKGIAYISSPKTYYFSSADLTNEGHAKAPLRYMQVSGNYDATGGTYPAYLSVRFRKNGSVAELYRKIILCDKMMRDDRLEFGWAVPGGAQHSYVADLRSTIDKLSLDVHSKTSGGAISSGVLTIDNSDYIMMPFYGPLPVSGEPDAVSIQMYVTAYSGSRATVYSAKETDLSDMAAVDHDALAVGWNTVYIPDLAGETHVAIGLKAASSGSLSMSYLKGTVKRYIAPSKIPAADIGEAFRIYVETNPSNVALGYCEALYNDRYYY